ncbi:MAG: hypothetical protein CM15mP107_3630 [Bacteroidota bacterium]|nr:MAG: hypothetical protein CM15mP107_3630 [Bacteroidota bacterium]
MLLLFEFMSLRSKLNSYDPLFKAIICLSIKYCLVKVSLRMGVLNSIYRYD